MFFDARRNIAKAACTVARAHKMELNLLDQESDNEREDYYSGRSTACTQSFQSSSSSVPKMTPTAMMNKKKKAESVLRSWNFATNRDN